MRVRGLIERLRSVFTPDEAANRRFGTMGSAPVFDSVRASDLRGLIDRLEGQKNTVVMAGCMQLLGLDQVKQRLGSNWGKFADEALLIAQTALEEYLGPGDVYRIVDDATFQICFESSDEASANFQIGRISRAIEERIAAISGTGNREVSVDSFVAPVPSERIRDASDPLSALYANLLEIRNAVNTRAIRRHSIPALRYAGALFQPMWSNSDSNRTKNRCVLDTLAGAAAAKHLEQIEDLDDLVAALANLDCVVFAKSIEGLHHALGEIKRATIVIPVHFQTLALEQQDYLDIAATLPLPYRRFVLLDLIGVPTATTQRELMMALKTGRTITDRIVLQMSPTDHRMDTAVRSLVWGVSINLGELDSDDPLIARELARFALNAAEHGLFSFAYGANTIGKAAAVVEAGFDHICGSAVANTVPVPRPDARFTPLFGGTVAQTTGVERKARLREHPRFELLDPNSTVTLPDGERFSCRIPNVSASGAVILTKASVDIHDYLVVGSIPAKVVRATRSGFAVRFLEVQHPSALEIALHTPVTSDRLLESLREKRG